jgi:hypothetical protein
MTAREIVLPLASLSVGVKIRFNYTPDQKRLGPSRGWHLPDMRVQRSFQAQFQSTDNNPIQDAQFESGDPSVSSGPDPTDRK